MIETVVELEEGRLSAAPEAAVMDLVTSVEPQVAAFAVASPVVLVVGIAIAPATAAWAVAMAVASATELEMSA